ncbi:MAG TPA: serine/threonine-protein kinase [Verrucomicrobiae bacterium]|jgi:serine/threonine protein kinase
MPKPSDIYGKPWSEREYIIVLHNYMLHREEPRHHLRDYVKDLANMLGRSVGSVVMRMENYTSLDPQKKQNRRGLVNISALGRKVFSDWYEKAESLHACAAVLIRETRGSDQPSLFDPEPVRLPWAFGKYDLLDPIGDGAFGSVYSCVNSDDQKIYAMKIIKTDKIANPEILGRFRREIKALKTLSHRNVIAIHEDNLDEQYDFPAFIMDLAESSLSAFLEKRLGGTPGGLTRPTLPRAEAVAILKCIVNAVQALHENKPPLIHRDLNPNNILLMSNGCWVLADFSLTKFLPTAVVTTTFATASHQGWGTDTYTAPEQWQDFKRTDQRADVYSLGVLIWEMLSPSWPPFDRACLMLPKPIEAVVLKATQRSRDLRQPSVKQLWKEFNKALKAVGAAGDVAT